MKRLAQEVEKRDGSRSITDEECRWGLSTEYWVCVSKKVQKKQPALDQVSF